MTYKISGFSNLIAFKRFLAKIVDLSIGYLFLRVILSFIVLIFLCLGIMSEEDLTMLDDKFSHIPKNIDTIIDMFLGFAISAIITPMQHHYFGNSFGKELFGIKLTKQNGTNLTLTDSESRETKVFFRGLCFGLFSCIYQYFAFRKNGILSWDKEGNYNVSYQDLSIISTIVRFIISIVILIYASMLFAALGLLDE